MATATEIIATEVLALKAGRGPGTMATFFQPELIEHFAVNSQGQFVLLDWKDSSGVISVYAPNGEFVRRISLLRPGEKPARQMARRLFIDGNENIYVPASPRRLRKFDRDGRFVRDFMIGFWRDDFVDRRGHIFHAVADYTMRELDAEGQMVREWTGLLDYRILVVDVRGEILARRTPAPSGIPVWPVLSQAFDRGNVFRDSQGNYYLNEGVRGVCTNFLKFTADRQFLWRLTHADLMRKMGYPHRNQEALRNGGPHTRGGRFCTLGWYLSPQDEIYALAASDSVPKHVPWLRVLRVQVR